MAIDQRLELKGHLKVARAFEGAKRRSERKLDQAGRAFGLRVVRRIQRRYRSGARTSATQTRVGTGALRASYGSVVRRASGRLNIVIGLLAALARGKALIYGAVHELGAVITPKRTKFLAIPLAAARIRSGTAGRPRDFPNTFVMPGRGGAPLIMQRRGEDLVPLFVLKRRVRIRARPPGGAINRATREEMPAFEQQVLGIIAQELAS